MKKFILGLIFLFSVGAINGQDLPVSGFAKKKAADKAKKTSKRNQSLKYNIPMYGFISSRLSKMNPNKTIFFTPVTSHPNLLIDLRKTFYYQNFGFDTFPKPIVFLRPPISW
ncbi:hypothetical protein [Pedobacter alpinus]|uniref:Uncharacterized protein n=1 Tax=Pedobacter alpinus TaxID=1590643 RepID=A0ABW5TXS2_9SPHI